MPAPAATEAPSPTLPRARLRWALEVGPLAAMVTLLWAKLVYFSALLPSEWWAPEETIIQWMRPAFHVVSAVQARPEVLASTLAALLVLVASLLVLPRLPRVLALLFLNLFLTSLGITDLVHVRFYADVVSLSDVVMAPMVLGVLPRVFESLSTLNALYYLDVVAGLLLLPWYLHACRRIPSLPGPARARLAFGVLGAGLVLAVPTVRMAWRAGPALLGYSNPRIELASAIGILPYHMGDLALRLAAGKPTIGEPERQRVIRFLAEHARTTQAPSPLFGVARDKNLIVVNAESLQAFPMDLQINGQPITPRLSAFARQSLYFTRFHDQTHLGTTSDAEFAAMHSLHPLAVGVLSNHFAYNQHRGLPRILSEHGYMTVSACAAQADFWNMRAMHRGLGFQRSYFDDRYQMTELIGPWLADHEFFAQTTSLLAAQPAPFMAFLLTASNHHPYHLPPEHRELALGDLEGTLLGDLLRRLRRREPRGARKRAADADAAHAERGRVLERDPAAGDEQVHRPGRGRLHHGGDVLVLADARRVEHVGAGGGIGLEAPHGLLDVRPAGEEAFRARGQEHASARAIDRRARRLDALDREREVEERTGLVAARVLDR